MYGVLRIDTDGKFHVDNFENAADAGNALNIDSESGLPAAVFESRQFIRDVVDGNI